MKEFEIADEDDIVSIYMECKTAEDALYGASFLFGVCMEGLLKAGFTEDEALNTIIEMIELRRYKEKEAF